MKKIILVMALLLTGLGLSACKFEASRVFDNNCSGNAFIHNSAHCDNFGT